MNDRVLNRINSARKTLGCLDEPAHKLIWQNQPPVIFTTKVGEANTLLAALLLTGQNQEKSTTGTTADKGREERELEDAAHTMAQALVTCCTDGNDLTTAAPFKMNITQWRVLRDEQLLAKAHALADAVAGVIAAGPVHASQYGLDTLTHSQLLKEADDYEALIAAPDSAIAARSALTASIPTQLAALEAKIDQLDSLLPQFRTKPGGPEFIAKYRLTRQINDRGHGPAPDAPPAPPAPPTA